LESEYQRLVVKNARFWYPNYHALRYHRPVKSSEGTKIPDLALVHRDYRDWWLVEVELAHHSLHAHVMPQVRILARGDFGDDDVRYMKKTLPSLDVKRLRDMVKGRPPKILVVVNAPQPRWDRELRPYGASIAVAQIFRSERERFIFRINGETLIDED